MLDAAPTPVMQRVRGVAEVGLTGTGLQRLFQQGSAKAILPRVGGDRPEVVFLNTAGGLTGGDRMRLGLTLGPGTRAVAATQTAERAYRSLSGVADVDVDLRLDEGAELDWLPQETILFEGSALSRRTRVDMEPGARILMAETIVLGRKAMGENIVDLKLADRREIWRGGAPVWIDPLSLTEALARRGGTVVLGGARVLSSLVMVGQGVEDALGRARTCLDHSGIEAGASAWDGRLVVRMMASDLMPLRHCLIGLVRELTGRPLPRVWQV